MKFQTNPGSVVELPELAAALSGAGVVLDQMTKNGDSNYTISSSDRVVATSAPLTASRTWTLPRPDFVSAGHPILVVDLAGGVTASNTLVITTSGGTINGTASVTLSVTNGAFYFVSDGAGAWSAQFLSPTSVPGTVTNVATAGLATGGPITATGTVTVTAVAKSDQTAGTSNTLAVTPLHQQDHDSALKAWVSFTGTAAGCPAGACAVLASYNVSSVTRASAGNYTVNFTTAFASANYACTGSASAASNTQMVGFSTKAAGNIALVSTSGGTFADATAVDLHCAGRQ